MNKGLKKFFHALGTPWVALDLGCKFSAANRKARKYHADPATLPIEKRYLYVYKLVRRVLYLFSVKSYTSGFKKCPKVPTLFVVNHKSLCDGLLIFKHLWENGDIPYFRMIAKGELGKGKIASVMHLIDSILINRNNIRDTANLFKEEIKPSLDKKSFVVFPEGTRIYDDQKIGEFKSGSFRIGTDHYLPIVPIVIYGSSGVGWKENKTFLNKNKQVFISVLPEIKHPEYISRNVVSVADEVRYLMEKEYKRIDEIVSRQPDKFVKDPHIVFETLDSDEKKDNKR